MLLVDLATGWLCAPLTYTYLVKPLDDGLVVLLAPLHHPRERVGEPLLEVRVRGKHGGHQEVHERPQLHQVVLQRGARQEQPALAVEVQQGLPALALEVLDVLGL